MHIVDAFLCKRPCRRPNRTFTYTPSSGLMGYSLPTVYMEPTSWKSMEYLLDVGALTPEDIVANDWEMKPDDERPL